MATGNSTYNLTFNYDRYGNMACQTNGQTNGPCPNWTFNSSANQITTAGYTYDAAGNVTSDNLTNYQWDAEGRLKSVNNGADRSYVYNALGREVEWHGDGRVSEDLTDLAGHYLGSVDPSSGAWTGERIPGSSIYLAWYVNGGTTFFHYNALGSSVMNTRQDGTVSNDVLFYPWGQMWASPVNDYFQFFGNIEGWDWEIGEGVTPNRYYPNYQGRWLSPDPLAGDISNPQSLNRYTYVLNNPTSLIDPSGQGSNTGCSNAQDFWGCVHQYYCGSVSCQYLNEVGSFLADPFQLQGIPVVAYGNGWIPVNGSGFPGPSFSGTYAFGGFSADTRLNVTGYWGPTSLGYLGDAFVWLGADSSQFTNPSPPAQDPTSLKVNEQSYQQACHASFLMNNGGPGVQALVNNFSLFSYVPPSGGISAALSPPRRKPPWKPLARRAVSLLADMGSGSFSISPSFKRLRPVPQNS